MNYVTANLDPDQQLQHDAYQEPKMDAETAAELDAEELRGNIPAPIPRWPKIPQDNWDKCYKGFK